MIGIKSYQRLIVGIFTGYVQTVFVVGVSRLHRQHLLYWPKNPLLLIERSNSIDKAIDTHHNQIINVIKL